MELELLAPAWGLAAARLAAFAALAPPFAYGAIPWPLRVAIGAVIAVPAAGLIVAREWTPPAAGEYPLALVAEAALGLALGWGVAALFRGAELAGGLLGPAAGLDAASSGAAEPTPGPLARLLLLLAFAVLVVTNGHLLLLREVLAGFETLPPGAWDAVALTPGSVVAAVAGCFVVGLRLVAPVLVLLWAWELAAGLVARVAPGWGWAGLAESVRPAAGLLAVALTLPLVWPTLVRLPTMAASLVSAALAGVAGG